MGHEQARRAIEHEVRAHFGTMLSAMWHITSSLKAINTTIFVPHMAGIRPIVELRELERKIERAVSPYCMERITVDVAQNWDGGGQVWINIGRERGGMEEIIESAVRRFIEDCTAVEWNPNPADPKRMATLTVRHELKYWTDGEKRAFFEKLKAAMAHKPSMKIWGASCGPVETVVHIINMEEKFSIHPRSGKTSNIDEPLDDYDQLFPKWWPNPDEPRWIIRDELTDWTMEQSKKKTEETKMANLMDIVKLVGKDEDIMLAVDGEEKEGTPEQLTPQMLAKHSCKQVHRIQDWEHSILLRVKE